MLPEKEEYRKLCEIEASIPIFSQAWWMDAACVGKEWDAIVVRGDDGEILGALPYLYGHKLMFNYICQPPYTQTNGVWIKKQDFTSEREKLRHECFVSDAVIDRLDSLNLTLFVQSFHSSYTNWLPFYWRKFKQTTRYTYRIDDIGNLDSVFASFSDAKKRHIRKAERMLMVDTDITANLFYEFCQSSYSKRGEKFDGERKVVTSLIDASRKRNQGEIICVRGNDGIVHSALFVVWDSASAYYLIPSTDPDFKTDGASSLVVWEAMKFVHGKTKSFDFEGSMIKGVENSYNQYGSRQIPYFVIWKQRFPILKL